MTPAIAPIPTSSAASCRRCGRSGEGHGGDPAAAAPSALARGRRLSKGSAAAGSGATSRSARRTSSGPAPARCAFSESTRRQARAPGRPWKAPSIWRMICVQPGPGKPFGLDVGQHRAHRRLRRDVRAWRAEDGRSAAPSSAGAW